MGWDEVYNYYLYSPTHTYSRPPVFYCKRDLPATGFTSLYAVSKESAEAIKQAGTTQGFKGVVWSPYLQVDVDSYEAAERTERRLKEIGLAYMAYDTGNRGAHFELARFAEPSHRLPYYERQWVRENLPEADLSVYTHLHPFRLEGTVHEKTGNKKEFIGGNEEGSEIELNQDGELPSDLIVQSSSMAGLISNNAGSVFDCFRVMANSCPAENGDRHTQLVRLCYALRDQAGVDKDVALWWSREVNKTFSEPKAEEDLVKIVYSIYT